MHAGVVRASTLLLLAAILPSCASAPSSPDLPYQIESFDDGRGQSFRGASFGAGDRIWTSGTSGTVLHRGSSRESWSRVQLPGAAELDLRDIDVRLDAQIFAMAAGEGVSSALFRSDSLGQHWQRVLNNPDAEGFFDALAFDAAGVGILVGDPIGGVFTLFRSIDGQGWSRVERVRSPQAAEGEYAFAASGSCLIAVGEDEFWFATGGSQARIWHSESSGSVWFDTGAPDVGGNESSGWFGLGADPAGSKIFAVGGDYAQPHEPSDLAIGGDEGWTHLEDAFPGFRSAVCAVPGRPGFWVAVGSHGADWSQDHGKSWQPLPIQGGHALTPADDGTVCVVGGPDHPHHLIRFD